MCPKDFSPEHPVDVAFKPAVNTPVDSAHLAKLASRPVCPSISARSDQAKSTPPSGMMKHMQRRNS